MSSKTVLKIEGMHCTSCAMNIDGELEDMDGVKSADTSYAKAESKVEYDPEVVSESDLINAVKKVGYSATISS